MWPCGWCLKMACPTDPPVGTSGATTGYLFLLLPYRIVWRRGEKKAQEHMGGAFLEWALEAFSGYAAVDELSMKGHTVSSLPWIIGTTNACCMRCLTTMRPIWTSKHFLDV